MKKKDLEQIESVIDKRITQSEMAIKGYVEKEIKTVIRDADEKNEFLARLTNKGFNKINKKLDKLNEKVDDSNHDVNGIERKQRAETKTLDNHEVRIKVLEKVH